jgi:hypothetical protein
MVSRPYTPFEEEVQRILDAEEDSKAECPAAQDKQIAQEESECKILIVVPASGPSMTMSKARILRKCWYNS